MGRIEIFPNLSFHNNFSSLENRLENKPILYNSTWKTSQELFCDQKSSWEVDPPCQNILRYPSLLTLSGFTGAWSGYLGSLGKRDKLLCPFLRFIPFIKIFYALLEYLILDLFKFNLLHLFLCKILAIFSMRLFKFPSKGSNFSGYFPKFSRPVPTFQDTFQFFQDISKISSRANMISAQGPVTGPKNMLGRTLTTILDYLIQLSLTIWDNYLRLSSIMLDYLRQLSLTI